MKSDNHRVIITVVLCMVILTVYTRFFGPDGAPPPPAAPVAAPHPGGEAAKPPGKNPAEDKPQAPAPTAAAQPAQLVPERLDGIESAYFRAVFSSHGGALKSFVLKHGQFVQADGKGLDLVTTQAANERPFTARFAGNHLDIPDHLQFAVEKATATEVLYVWEGAKARVEKRLAVGTGHYVIEMEVRILKKGGGNESATLAVDLFGRALEHQDGGFLKPPPDLRETVCHAEGKLVKGPPEQLAEKPLALGQGVLWAGIADRYFLVAALPAGDLAGARCEGRMSGPALLSASLVMPLKFDAGGLSTSKVVLYGGPKFVHELDAVTVPGRDAKLGDAVDYGWLGPIARLLLELLLFFYRVFSNWGVAIILLTLVVKLITLYPTQKSMRSMKGMAKLKPEIESLKKRFGDDKTRLNNEMMALYKQKGINPLGGCLPMLIQMPVWFALYSTLGNAVELYHSHFLWMKDLTKPDPFFIVPVVMGGCMFIQQKTAPQPADSEQQKILMYAMPVMFTLFSLWFPAGLTVYILTNTLLTMAHQTWMNRSDSPRARA